MLLTQRKLAAQKNIALVAHDHRKASLVNWCNANKNLLCHHHLYGTGTTGNLLQRETGLAVQTLLSGPMGGDQQLGSMIAQGEIDSLIFFWDPLNAVPHDPDVKALLRLATVWNIPVATNESSADLIISNPLFNQTMEIAVPDYDRYLKDRIEQ
ncbi:methylglyoxal synthase [Halioxenophilus aromaticivorans]|uniref:Methylglyoxal synthase n=1 Tax=Halioxenophilus aromaticivorans TaxID=1306992 RepID=A0AAV3U552_9ALTE